MKTKILLVDDENDIIEFLKYNLEQEGFEVISANNGEEALKKISLLPDLVILDIMMPKMDGFEVCNEIRMKKGFENLPVIFLTAKSSEIDEIKGLELGADDFIRKPISPKKLIARVKANLRKNENQIAETKPEDKLIIGPLEINRDKYSVFLDGKELFLPRKEFEILNYLAHHPGKVFSRETILREVWGTDVFVVERTIDVHVRKIREKCEKYPEMIETIKGVGYKFKGFE